MSTPKRAPRGSSGDCIPYGTTIAPEIAKTVRSTVQTRGVTLRAFMEAALLMEIADPTVTTATALKRAPRGSSANIVALVAQIDPEIARTAKSTVAERRVTLRRFLESALLREVANPTIINLDQELPLGISA